jgi:hypothetical protein
MLPTNHTPNKVKQLNVIHLIPRIRALATHMAVGNFHTGTTEGMFGYHQNLLLDPIQTISCTTTYFCTPIYQAF